MAKIPTSKLIYIKSLYYKKKFSMNKIALNLGVSLDAVVYFMRHNNLKKRTASENEKIKFARKLPSFKIKKDLNQEEKELKTLGISLYWGEGYKSKKAKNVDFANSDMEMIKVFMNFLRKICGIDESKIRIYLYCYSNQKPFDLIKFWSRITKVPASRFSKPYIRQDFHESKIGKMKNGMIHIRYYDKKLLILLLSWIEELKRDYS